MEQRDCNRKEKKYKHLDEKDRIKIEVLLEEKHKVKEIASILGKHRATIYREIRKGTINWKRSDWQIERRYRSEVGQRVYKERAANKERSLKIGRDHKLVKHIIAKIKQERYSPDAVIGEIKSKGLKFKGMICTKTLYNYINGEIIAGISNKDLWEKGRRKRRRNKQKRRISLKNRKCRSIEERPEEIEKREEYGHWEGDCVKGAIGTKEVLFTLTERKTSEEIIIKLKACKQEEVKKAIDGLEKRYGERFKEKFKTITFDNGGEFLRWEELERSKLKPFKKRTTIYFAHPYSSWERGLNENANKMIRRFIPKGISMKKISIKEIEEIENWMNNYPRKKLGYKSPKEVVDECFQNNGNFGIPLEVVAL